MKSTSVISHLSFLFLLTLTSLPAEQLSSHTNDSSLSRNGVLPSAGFDVARSGNDVFIAWQRPAGAFRNVEIYRNNRMTADGRVRIATITPSVGTFLEPVPASTTTYWYWLVVNRPDGAAETIGPVPTPSAEVWVP